MPRLPINPAFDRASNTRRGLRVALAVGLGTLLLGLAAGAVAARGNQTSRIAHVRHVDSGEATAPSSLRAGDLFVSPASPAPDDAVAPAAPAAAPAAHAESESESETMSSEHKNGVPPPTDDSVTTHAPGGTPAAKPKPHPSPSPEPSQSPEPPSPND
jgi:hypothetical protein